MFVTSGVSQVKFETGPPFVEGKEGPKRKADTPDGRWQAYQAKEPIHGA